MVERPADDLRSNDLLPDDELVQHDDEDNGNPEATSEPQEELPKGLLVGNPKLQILLIAGVFYAILIAMCLFVGILVFRG